MSNLFVLALLIGISNACHAASLPTTNNVQLFAERRLSSFLLEATARNSPRNIVCFEEYLPKLNQLTDEYEQAYGSCLNATANSKQRVESEVAKDRSNVEALAEDVCQLYSKCSTVVASADFFECYFNASEQAAVNSYTIQTTSKSKSQYIQLRYQTIQYDETVCTDTCKATYVEETAKTYAELDKCLAGLSA
ncbi:protein TsetseEP-like [Musca domestica]|uniref:Protein TsetseEP-like n=1 Tax=Musca domestica TaxID=7370 RepID=A0ABM3V9B7_MUSDO|nr:protein TsetseEP-like [Musca domestica]